MATGIRRAARALLWLAAAPGFGCARDVAVEEVAPGCPCRSAGAIGFANRTPRELRAGDALVLRFWIHNHLTTSKILIQRRHESNIACDVTLLEDGGERRIWPAGDRGLILDDRTYVRLEPCRVSTRHEGVNVITTWSSCGCSFLFVEKEFGPLETPGTYRVNVEGLAGEYYLWGETEPRRYCFDTEFEIEVLPAEAEAAPPTPDGG